MDTKKIINQCMVTVISILVGTLVLGLCSSGYRHLFPKHDYSLDFIKENELKYWETKSQLTTEVQNYIDSVAPTSLLRAYELVDLCEKYNINIMFPLAHGEKESHFGTKGLASKTNSVWNVGAYDSVEFTKISRKYKYPHPNESIEPYLKLLSKYYLVDKTEEDLLVKYENKYGERYASDPRIEEALRVIYSRIDKNTNISKLSELMRYYAIRCNRE